MPFRERPAFPTESSPCLTNALFQFAIDELVELAFRLKTQLIVFADLCHKVFLGMAPGFVTTIGRTNASKVDTAQEEKRSAPPQSGPKSWKIHSWISTRFQSASGTDPAASKLAARRGNHKCPPVFE